MTVNQVAQVEERLFWQHRNRRGRLWEWVRRRQRWLGEAVGGTEQS